MQKKTIITLFFILCHIQVFAQDQNISIKKDNAPLSEIFEDIERQSNYTFFYVDADIKNIRKSINATNKSIENIVGEILQQTNLKYIISGKNINIFTKNKSKEKYTISGTVRDNSNGEIMIGATIYVENLKNGTTTNGYGFYSIELPAGEHFVSYYFMGYETKKIKINLEKNTEQNVALAYSSHELNEVIVNTNNKKEVSKSEIGAQKISRNTIQNIPAVLGEVDVVKALQLLPGVQAPSENAAGYSVRNGMPDQNLTLLDDAPIYSLGHLLGFFSVFNNDAIKDIKLYKGEIPAAYGGRISSLLDVRMRDGNSQRFSGTGSVSLISAKIMLEGPIVKDKVNFMISARRTYADLLILPLINKVSNNEDEEDNWSIKKLYFYDINAKINYTINSKNRIFFSAFSGRDVIRTDSDDADYNDDIYNFTFDNNTQSLRWNHIFSPKIFANITLVNSIYNAKSSQSIYKADNGYFSDYNIKSGLNSQSAKADFSWYPNINNTIYCGAQATYITINPGKINDIENPENEYRISKNNGMEYAAYISNSQKIGRSITLQYGLRFSIFQKVGKSAQLYFNKNHEQIDSKYFGTFEPIKTYSNLEPRLSATAQFLGNNMLRIAYTRTTQYIQQAQYSTIGLPYDVWFSASPNVKPQICDLFSMEYSRSYANNKIQLSADVYYKKMRNTIDFKSYPDILTNEALEGELRFGKSYAYGAEFMLKVNTKKLNGWIGYTYSDAKIKIADINNGKSYRSPYNHKHNLSATLNFDISPRVSAAANFVYYSGTPATLPLAIYAIEDRKFLVFSERNAKKYADSHRLDIALTWRNKNKPNKKWKGEWVFSIYNVYGHKNIWGIYFDQIDDSGKVQIRQSYLYTFVPSIAYNFKF